MLKKVSVQKEDFRGGEGGKFKVKGKEMNRQGCALTTLKMK